MDGIWSGLIGSYIGLRTFRYGQCPDRTSQDVDWVLCPSTVKYPLWWAEPS